MLVICLIFSSRIYPYQKQQIIIVLFCHLIYETSCILNYILLFFCYIVFIIIYIINFNHENVS